MEVVLLRRFVLDELKWLEVRWWNIIALDGKGTLLDALNNVVVCHVG